MASVGITIYSWRSLKQWRSHGFYRFFVFESIIALILLNSPNWFRDPFSVTQIISWLLLAASLAMAIAGFYLLGTAGRPRENFENTTVLVTRGVYRYVRHPLYSSLLLLGWGAFFKDPSFISGILVVVISAFLFATARAEEAENIKKFGADYSTYMKATRMFIPFLV